ncbi:hypothetical protein JNO12_24885 [Erwinia aphidicola]|nr:hypothetical protein [Erwinia aphidicola]
MHQLWCSLLCFSASRSLYEQLAGLQLPAFLAAQALDFHDASQAGEGTRRAHALLREQVATWTDDRWLAPEIAKAALLMKTQSLAA